MTLTYIKASCYCRLNEFLAPILTKSLPQETDMCHCNACRHITGQMFLLIVMMSGPPLSIDSGLTPETHQLADISKLVMYKASDKVLRYYCPRCFAHILYDLHQPGQQPTWAVSSGALERTEGIIKIGYHIFVPDTLDGGVADHVRVMDGKELPRYTGWEGTKQVPIGWKAEELAASTRDKSDRLYAYCHCKAISLYITRPRQPEDKLESKSKFKATHCFCNTCRLTSGSIFTTYIQVPAGCIFDASTELRIQPTNSEAESPTKGLTHYISSEGVLRESCSSCGANVFVWSKEPGKVSQTLRLHMGLLDEKINGAKAEDWVEFADVIDHGDDALDKVIAKAVQEEMKP